MMGLISGKTPQRSQSMSRRSSNPAPRPGLEKRQSSYSRNSVPSRSSSTNGSQPSAPNLMRRDSMARPPLGRSNTMSGNNRPQFNRTTTGLNNATQPRSILRPPNAKLVNPKSVAISNFDRGIKFFQHEPPANVGLSRPKVKHPTQERPLANDTPAPRVSYPSIPKSGQEYPPVQYPSIPRSSDSSRMEPPPLRRAPAPQKEFTGGGIPQDRPFERRPLERRPTGPMASAPYAGGTPSSTLRPSHQQTPNFPPPPPPRVSPSQFHDRPSGPPMMSRQEYDDRRSRPSYSERPMVQSAPPRRDTMRFDDAKRPSMPPPPPRQNYDGYDRYDNRPRPSSRNQSEW